MNARTTMLAIAAVAGAGTLFATKPSPAEIDRKIDDMVRSGITNAKLDDDNLVGNLLLLGCKAGASDCAALLRQGMDVTVSDKVLFSRVSIHGPSGSLECLGILNQLYCPGFLNGETT